MSLRTRNTIAAAVALEIDRMEKHGLGDGYAYKAVWDARGSTWDRSATAALRDRAVMAQVTLCECGCERAVPATRIHGRFYSTYCRQRVRSAAAWRARAA